VATLGQYMSWLKSIGGSHRSGIAADPAVGMVPVVKLISPNGRHVVHPGNDQSEELSPYMVEYFDRRLQVISPFRSVPRA
jgi:hypothetical protein